MIIIIITPLWGLSSVHCVTVSAVCPASSARVMTKPLSRAHINDQEPDHRIACAVFCTHAEHDVAGTLRGALAAGAPAGQVRGHWPRGHDQIVRLRPRIIALLASPLAPDSTPTLAASRPQRVGRQPAPRLVRALRWTRLVGLLLCRRGERVGGARQVQLLTGTSPPATTTATTTTAGSSAFRCRPPCTRCAARSCARPAPCHAENDTTLRAASTEGGGLRLQPWVSHCT